MVRLLAASVALLVVFPPPAGTPALDLLLTRVAIHVADFKAKFSLVVGTERYNQIQRDMNRRTRTRQMRSDVFFFGPDADGPAMTVRTVQSMDGRVTRNAARQIEEALALPQERRIEKLRALADAGARYNLGSLQRNFNEPTLALTFGGAGFQDRFRFQLEGTEAVDGREHFRLSFTETGRPTVIQDGRAHTDIPAEGRLWADADGVIRRTELRLQTADALATIQVLYHRDQRLGIMVPASMDEDYRYRDGNDARVMFVTARATYSGYRRFETAVRMLTP